MSFHRNLVHRPTQQKPPFKIDDYVELEDFFFYGGLRGQVIDVRFKKNRGWQIAVDFSKTTSWTSIERVWFYPSDLKLIRVRSYWWLEVIKQTLKRWFKIK